MLARVVTQSGSRTSAKHLLQSLHWLPIRERFRHKVATLTSKAHRMSSPPYLSSLQNDHIPSRTLRPSSTPRLIVPRTRTELAKWAFCVAAPSLWNSLPVDVVDTNIVLTFKKHFNKLICIIAPTSQSVRLAPLNLWNIRRYINFFFDLIWFFVLRNDCHNDRRDCRLSTSSYKGRWA